MSFGWNRLSTLQPMFQTHMTPGDFKLRVVEEKSPESCGVQFLILEDHRRTKFAFIRVKHE